MKDNRKRFLEFEDDASPESIRKVFARYKDYLHSVKDFFSDNTYEFAIADWHYNANDYKCPHDSWLESFQLIESGKHDDISKRSLEIKITLLGAYHNGRINLHYKGVSYYFFEKNIVDGFLGEYKTHFANSHGDWDIDEIYLSEDQFTVHEIKFRHSVKWKIYCKDINYRWIPFEDTKSN